MAAASKKKARKQPAKTAVKKKKKTAAKTAKPKRVAKASPVARTAPARRGRGDGLIHGIVPYKARRGEEYMNAAQMRHFRAILEAWRQELVEEINRTITSMQDETINHPDPNDRATQETDMSMELRSRDRERKLIKKIDDTLIRIEEDDYGFCEKCGVEIGIARLEARPTATLCIDCKTLDEIREKQMV